MDLLLRITTALERRVIKQNNHYEASIIRLRRRACMALHARRSPLVFARLIKRSKLLLARLRRHLRLLYIRRRRCVVFSTRLRILRLLIGRHRATLVRAVRRRRSIRRHLHDMLRRQRQLRSRQSKKACRFRLARLTKRIKRETQTLKKVRSFMISSQNRLVKARQSLLKANRSLMAIKCRKLKRVGSVLSRRYRQEIFRMRRIMRRCHRRWLLARRHLLEALRMAAASVVCVRRCYREVVRSARRLRRRRRLLCEGGHRKFCILPEVRPRAPTILRLSLAGKCGVALSKVKPRGGIRAKRVRAKPRNEKLRKEKARKEK